MIRKPLPVTGPRPFMHEARYLQERRDAILQWAGRRWALHPDNSIQRPQPPPPAFFGPR